MSIKYRMNAEVKEEALSHLHQLEILMGHLFRDEKITTGVIGYMTAVLKDHINAAKD